MAEELADGAAGQMFDGSHRCRNGVRGKVLPAMGQQVVLVEHLVGCKHDERGRAAVVGQDCGVDQCGMLGEYAFDVAGIDRVARDAVGVIDAIDDPDVAILVDAARVSGVEPAVVSMVARVAAGLFQ